MATERNDEFDINEVNKEETKNSLETFTRRPPHKLPKKKKENNQ